MDKANIKYNNQYYLHECPSTGMYPRIESFTLLKFPPWAHLSPLGLPAAARPLIRLLFAGRRRICRDPAAEADRRSEAEGSRARRKRAKSCVEETATFRYSAFPSAVLRLVFRDASRLLPSSFLPFLFFPATFFGLPSLSARGEGSPCADHLARDGVQQPPVHGSAHLA